MTEQKALSVDPSTLPHRERYKLLTGLVIPRPIAFVTSMSDKGVVNAAPFSFFNVFSEKPPLVIVGLQVKADLSLKDTTRNVRANGLFVINMVDEALANTMVDCSIGFPSGVGEPDALKLQMAPGVHVAVPHLAGSPAALECRKVTLMNFGAERDLLVGEVLGIQVRDGVVDPDTLRTNYEHYLPVGRVAGTMYARMQDRFEIKPDTFETWQLRNDR